MNILIVSDKKFITYNGLKGRKGKRVNGEMGKGKRAESPIINNAGRCPANRTHHIRQALKGRNPDKQIVPFQGFRC
jgi:hypothetical protein